MAPANFFLPLSFSPTNKQNKTAASTAARPITPHPANALVVHTGPSSKHSQEQC
jgi:hypothetical protein